MVKPSTNAKSKPRRARKATAARPPQAAAKPAAQAAGPAPGDPAMFDPPGASAGDQGTAPEARAADGPAEAPVEQAETPADDKPAAAPDGAEPKAEEGAPAPTAEEGEELFDELFGGGEGGPVPEDQAAPAADAEAPLPDPADQPAPSVTSTRIMLGLVEGQLYRVPIDVVQSLLGSEAHDRINVLRSNPTSILALQDRMRATDGRCAPVFFTAPDDATVAPTIFSGIESVAAGLELGLRHLAVITVDPEDAGALQSYLVHSRSGAPAETEDDLVRRVNASWDDID